MSLDSLFTEGAIIPLRDRLAMVIINGIISGDWNFPTSFNGKEGVEAWDEQAATRAYQIADAMLRQREA